VTALNPVYHHNAGLALLELSLAMDVLKHLRLSVAFGEPTRFMRPQPAQSRQQSLDAP